MKFKAMSRMVFVLAVASVFAIAMVACSGNSTSETTTTTTTGSIIENEFMSNEDLAENLAVVVTFYNSTKQYSAKCFNNGTVGGSVSGTWGWDGADLTMTLTIDGSDTEISFTKNESGDLSFSFTPRDYYGNPGTPVTMNLTYATYSLVLTENRRVVYKGVEEFNEDPTIVLALYSQDKWQGMYLMSDHTFHTVFSSTGDPDNAPLATVQYGYWGFNDSEETLYLNEQGQITTATPEVGSGDLKFSNTIYIGGYTIIRELVARKADWRLAILGEAAPMIVFYGTLTQLNLLSDMTCELIDFTNDSIDGEIILVGSWTYDEETSEVTVTLDGAGAVSVGSEGELSLDFNYGSLDETLTTSSDWEDLLKEDVIVEKEVWFEFTGEGVFFLYVYDDNTCHLMYITDTVRAKSKIGTWSFDAETTSFSLFLGDSTDDPEDYVEYTVTLTAENAFTFSFSLPEPPTTETLTCEYSVWQPLLDPAE